MEKSWKCAGGGWRRAEIINDWAHSARKKGWRVAEWACGALSGDSLAHCRQAVSRSLLLGTRNNQETKKKRIAAPAFLVRLVQQTGFLNQSFLFYFESRITYLFRARAQRTDGRIFLFVRAMR